MQCMLVARQLLSVCVVTAVLAVVAGNADQAKTAFRDGNCSFDNGYFADAVKMYTRALEQDPHNAKACFNRALANEMVDRKAAIRDWKRFLDISGSSPDGKAAASEVGERLDALEKMPALPSTLQPSAYLPKAGDYYNAVAQASAGLQFSRLPVKIFLGSLPQGWQTAIRQALDGWVKVFPLKEVPSREGADIVLSWAASTKESHRAGRENDWAQVERKEDGTIAKRTKIAFVDLDSSGHWSEEQKLATVLHELGHALGIQGHSDKPRDVMFGTIRDVQIEVTPGGPFSPPDIGPAPWNMSLPRNPSQRDVNTLIRLYNSPSPLKRLE